MDLEAIENISDVRDGMTRNERVVLYCIDQIQKERDNGNVPTVMLYGRVIEYVYMSENKLQMILQCFTGDDAVSSEQI